MPVTSWDSVSTDEEIASLVAPNVKAFLAQIEQAINGTEINLEAPSIMLDFYEQHIHSPIEQLFWAAIKYLCYHKGIGFQPSPPEEYDHKHCFGGGLNIYPQFEIDNYKADFHLVRTVHGEPASRWPLLVVELDGHAFHNANLTQRTYEKKRDRHFAKRGLTVLHYTGSDIVKDPYKAAREAFDFLGWADSELGEIL